MAQYTAKTSTEIAEDCRDYLRTGRCKYGTSCKYNHPADVQSGGGIKAPIDPSGPLFPVRPNEASCQYYIKHGTCKFGQACKFNHPPDHKVEAAVGSSGIGQSLILNLDGIQQQSFLNTGGGDGRNNGIMLQFLPQRPNEPDCIYFLRNGRCKYGATCRYHHPLNINRQQVEVLGTVGRQQPHQQSFHGSVHPPGYGLRRSESDGTAFQNGPVEPLSFTSQGYPEEGGHGNYGKWAPPRGGPGGTQMQRVVEDDFVAVVAMNQQNGPPQQPTNAGGGLGPSQYYRPRSNNHGNNSSYHEDSLPSPVYTSSSVSSSYETSVSSFEVLPGSSHAARQQQLQSDGYGGYVRRSRSYQHLNEFNNSAGGGNINTFSEASEQRRNIGSSQMSSPALVPENNSGSTHPQRHTMSNDGSNGRNFQQQQQMRFRDASFNSSFSQNESLQSSHHSDYEGRSNNDWKSHSFSDAERESTRHPPSGPKWEDIGLSPMQELGNDREPQWADRNNGRQLSASAPSHFLDDRSRFDKRRSYPPTSVVPQDNVMGHNQYQHRVKQSGADDEGMSIMTSALLNMLDITSEEGKKSPTRPNHHVTRGQVSSAPPTPQLSTSFSSFPDDSSAGSIYSNGGMPSEQVTRLPFAKRSTHHSFNAPEEGRVSGAIPPYGTRQQGSFDAPGYQDLNNSYHSDHLSPPMRESQGWSPSWSNSQNHGQDLERNSQPVSMLQTTSAGPSSHGTHNMGLFLS
eukprot:scaffold26532_cov56-Attheya_sp.AAC.4